ncbi:hypothetical protein NQ317_007326 [Molorchus minor]|uniref:Carboxylesterase type B domain-containing protein n=1 Tax=Molorchus minor TaxID=1323400 RepID=A0ABQ9IXH5_9CUCU|nr:hypothetical protein NQ317_007326 [Molorchus minor]
MPVADATQQKQCKLKTQARGRDGIFTKESYYVYLRTSCVIANVRKILFCRTDQKISVIVRVLVIKCILNNMMFMVQHCPLKKILDVILGPQVHLLDSTSAGSPAARPLQFAHLSSKRSLSGLGDVNYYFFCWRCRGYIYMYYGFLSTEDDVIPGNLGMKDQVLALKWVKILYPDLAEVDKIWTDISHYTLDYNDNSYQRQEKDVAKQIRDFYMGLLGEPFTKANFELGRCIQIACLELAPRYQ